MTEKLLPRQHQEVRLLSESILLLLLPPSGEGVTPTPSSAASACLPCRPQSRCAGAGADAPRFLPCKQPLPDPSLSRGATRRSGYGPGGPGAQGRGGSCPSGTSLPTGTRSGSHESHQPSSERGTRGPGGAGAGRGAIGSLSRAGRGPGARGAEAGTPRGPSLRVALISLLITLIRLITFPPE